MALQTSRLQYLIVVSFLAGLTLFFGFTYFNSNSPPLNDNIHTINDDKPIDNQNDIIPNIISVESIIEDDNIEEFLRLGLTPNHSIRIESINTDNNNEILSSKILHGRFLHITDMHPDPLFKAGGLMTEKCHRLPSKKDKKDKDAQELESHKYGDALSGCDSPIALFENTLAWIKENLKDKIDFVIWTGDNIRHDNDRRNPRLEMDILSLNEKVADKMSDVFMDDNESSVIPINRRVKIIPSIGNNDVYPHNLFAPGPTLQTREMYKIWKNFVPAEQMHIFDRGVYYFQEVIPGKLAIVSINTLYFFRSNPLNDNCDRRKEPGYMLFEWLGITLKELRKRDIKVWLTGHVPPIPHNLHFSCYTKMAVWLHEYRDIIVGGLYGHMNIDHFIPLDSVKAWSSINKRLNRLGVAQEDNVDILRLLEAYNESPEEFDQNDIESLYKELGLPLDPIIDDPDEEDYWDVVTEAKKVSQQLSPRYDGAPSGKVDYLKTIRDDMYAKIKGRFKAGVHGDRYSISHVTASVIPTYNPGFRIWEYNITDILKSSNKVQEEFEPWTDFFARVEKELDESKQIADMLDTLAQDDKLHVQYGTLKTDKTIPPMMPANRPLGPAYTRQLFSPEKYTQYFVDLDKYANGEYPDDKFEFKVQYSTDDSTYQMDSLLVEDWLKLGKKISKPYKPVTKKDSGSDSDLDSGLNLNSEELIELFGTDDELEVLSKSEKLWEAYLDRAFISTGYQEIFKGDD